MFADRSEAGRRLAQQLQHLGGENVVVLGLPRGGVPVALEVARALEAPLDVIVVRKVGAPFQPELGMGAVGEDGVKIVNQEVLRLAGLTGDEFAVLAEQELREVERRALRFRGDRAPVSVAGRTVVMVDDGIATGSTARAACRIARAHGAARIVLAVPVAPPGWTTSPGEDADELVCLESPPDFFAISQSYGDFAQTTDEEVMECLHQAAAAVAPPASRRLDRPPGGAAGFDPVLDRAGEEADGVDLYGSPPSGRALVAEREEAQGVEVFDDPDAVIPAGALREGAPGHEALSGDQVGLGKDEGEEAEDRGGEEVYDI